MARQTDEAVVREGRVLLGFMSEDEMVQFASGQIAQPIDEIRPLWAGARAAVDAIVPPRTRAPELLPMPSEVGPELSAVAAMPVFQEAMSGRRPEFVLIELDPLIAFQQFVDTQFARGEEAPSSTDVLAQVRHCIPRDFSADLSVAMDQQSMAVTVTSLSRNVSVAGIGIQSGPDQPVQIAFAIRTRANWVQVAEHEGRYFLKNGYHRVWALRSAGVRHVPAILTRAQSYDEVGAGPGFFSAGVLLSERPPLFGDFLNDALAPACRLKSTMKVLRFKAEEFVLPRLP